MNEEVYYIKEKDSYELGVNLDIFSTRAEYGKAKPDEILMMEVVKKCFNIEAKIVPGNAEHKEPDFIDESRNSGFEMTFISNRGKNSLIG